MKSIGIKLVVRVGGILTWEIACLPFSTQPSWFAVVNYPDVGSYGTSLDPVPKVSMMPMIYYATA